LASARVFHGARFADDLYLDLARILHGFFDLAGDVPREPQRRKVVDGFGPHDNADFTACLQRVALFDAVKAGGDFFEHLHAADVRFEAFTPRAGSRARNGVGGFDDVRLDIFLFDFVVVACNRVHDARVQPVALGELRADHGVGSFHLMVDGLAEVMEQAAGLGDHDVRAQFGGDHTGDMRGFNRVGMLVLAVAGAEFQPAQQLDNFGMQAMDAGFISRPFAFLADDLLDFG